MVADGYDAIAERYATWAASFESPTMRWVEKLLDLLEDSSDVLELGCGGGGPATMRLAKRHRLLGVDISSRQIERARERVPEASFERADATELMLESESFDAVVSLFMLGHVPRAEQAPLLGSIGVVAPRRRLPARHDGHCQCRRRGRRRLAGGADVLRLLR